MAEEAAADPHAVLQALAANEFTAQRAEALALLIKTWVATAPLQAIEAVYGIKDDDLQEMFLRELMGELILTNPEVAASWLSNLGENLRGVIAEELRKQAAIIPFENGRLFASTLRGKLRDEWVASFVAHWYGTKGDDLLLWAAGLDIETQTVALRSALPRLAATDPRAAVARAEAAGTAAPFDTRRRIAVEWARTDPNSALDWVETFAPGAKRGVAIRGILKAVAESDPAAAAEAALQIQDADLQLAACADVLQEWAKSDPVKAAEWAASFPPGRSHGEAIKAVAPAFTRSDWLAAGAWIRSLPPSLERDAVIGEYVQEIQERYPADAASWALRISREDERARRLKNALETWTKADPEAAQEWQARNLQQSPESGGSAPTQ